MHQIIFSPSTIPSFLSSKVIDIEDKNITSLCWGNMFTFINTKYNIPTNIIKIKTSRGKFVKYTNIDIFQKFPFDKFCYYDQEGNPLKSYLIKFDI